MMRHVFFLIENGILGTLANGAHLGFAKNDMKIIHSIFVLDLYRNTGKQR